jgi:NAD(P)H-hydrate epimerase
MKLVSPEIMQYAENQTIEVFGIPGLCLMERAGEQCTEIILSRFGNAQNKCAVVLAGKGNNGGDGLVVARLLDAKGWNVKVIVFASRAEIHGDAAANLNRLKDEDVLFCKDICEMHRYVHELQESTLIVDAIIGTGLKKPLTGILRDAVEFVNNFGAPVMAVDIPSGIDSATGQVLGVAIRADVTVTFALAKLGHVLYPGAEYCGHLHVVDIGIPKEVVDAAPGFEFLDKYAICKLIRKRQRIAHKGDCGHALIIAGSTGKSGAAAMSANSAVRSGAGLVTVAVPEAIHSIMEIKTTEAMTASLPDFGKGTLDAKAWPAILGLTQGKDSVAIGPGLGWQPSTKEILEKLLTVVDLPVVIDADGLNALSENVAMLLRKKTSKCIITPHPGEMARLTGKSVAMVEADRIFVSRDVAMTYDVYVILKGARTIIASPEGEVSINGSGNPGMATGGMGDVLVGILAAFLAQGYSPYTACQLGVYAHGYAADLVSQEKGEIGISAVDVQERIPYALKELLSAA